MADPVQSYVSCIDAWVMVDVPGCGWQRFETTGIELFFPFNGIPEATFNFAVGANAYNEQELAKVHELAHKFKNGRDIKAYVHLTGDEYRGPNGAPLSWPDKDLLVWEGITAGITYGRSREQMGFSMTSLHWLERLQATSLALSTIWRGSADMLDGALNFASSKGNSPRCPTVVGVVISEINDLWDSLIKKGLVYLTGGDPNNLVDVMGAQVWNDFATRYLKDDCTKDNNDPTKELIGASTTGNKLALDIINTRFNNAAEICPGLLPLSRYFLSKQEDVLSNNIADTVSCRLGDRIGQATAWEKIFALSQEFQFALCANVNAVATVPHVPFLDKDHLWRVINADEYTALRGQAYTPRVLRGVGLFSKMVTDTSTPGDQADTNTMTGVYDNCTNGSFMFKDAPNWVQLPCMADKLTAWTSKGLIPSAIDPSKTSHLDTDSRTQLRNKFLDKLASSQLGNRLAHTLWLYEVYNARNAALTGRLRFDICPGSHIMVKGIGHNLPGYTASNVYANVSGVRINMDAQSTQCSTSLYLSHLRTSEEESDAVTGHPLYQTAWCGSVLVKVRASDMTCCANADATGVVADTTEGPDNADLQYAMSAGETPAGATPTTAPEGPPEFNPWGDAGMSTTTPNTYNPRLLQMTAGEP